MVASEARSKANNVSTLSIKGSVLLTLDPGNTQPLDSRGTSLVTLCKFLKENKQHSPSDGMKKKIFFNQQTVLPFAGC